MGEPSEKDSGVVLLGVDQAQAAPDCGGGGVPKNTGDNAVERAGRARRAGQLQSPVCF